MVPVILTLAELTAGDLMSREVVALPERLSMREAARRLARSAIHGAPVVDEAGRCVGVLSVADISLWAGCQVAPSQIQRWPPSLCFGVVTSPIGWPLVVPDQLPDDEVRFYMTPTPVTVLEGIRIGALARRMLDAAVQQVIVVDENGRPIGVVSCTDMLAALAGAGRRRRAWPPGTRGNRQVSCDMSGELP